MRILTVELEDGRARVSGEESLSDDELRDAADAVRDELSERGRVRARAAGVSVEYARPDEVLLNVSRGVVTLGWSESWGYEVHVNDRSVMGDLGQERFDRMGADVRRVLDAGPDRGLVALEALRFMDEWRTELDEASVREVQED